jgi:hypothetical protein
MLVLRQEHGQAALNRHLVVQGVQEDGGRRCLAGVVSAIRLEDGSRANGGTGRRRRRPRGRRFAVCARLRRCRSRLRKEELEFCCVCSVVCYGDMDSVREMRFGSTVETAPNVPRSTDSTKFDLMLDACSTSQGHVAGRHVICLIRRSECTQDGGWSIILDRSQK